MGHKSVVLLVLVGSVSAHAQPAAIAMKTVEEHLASKIEETVNNGNSMMGGINSHAPKAEGVKVTVAVDWATYKGQLTDAHGYAEVERHCVLALCGVSELDGDPATRTVLTKAARTNIKTIRCSFDATAAKGPVHFLKGGVLRVGFSWKYEPDSHLTRDWLIKQFAPPPTPDSAPPALG